MNEWDWIDYLKKHVGKVDGVVGIGDDAALLPGGWTGKVPAPAGSSGLLATTDTFVEGIHFRTDWASWASIGRKIAEASISDIAAMGGTPLWMLANLSSAVSDVGVGLLEGIVAAGVPLVGGDTTGAAKGSTTVTLTVLGKADRPVLRSGAKPGDGVYVSGALGGSRGGLASLERGIGLRALEERFLQPRARLDIATAWGKTASAMIDISDGLSSELHHIADESHVRIEIDFDSLPIFPGLEELDLDPIETALESGEEFELLAAAPAELPGGIRIGRVVEGRGVFDLKGSEIRRTGYTHWRT